MLQLEIGGDRSRSGEDLLRSVEIAGDCLRSGGDRERSLEVWGDRWRSLEVGTHSYFSSCSGCVKGTPVKPASGSSTASSRLTGGRDQGEDRPSEASTNWREN